MLSLAGGINIPNHLLATEDPSSEILFNVQGQKQPDGPGTS